jgi:Uma2 family endonuclease
MAAPPPKPWSLEDFLAWEERQPERFEFVDGVIRGMVGGTAYHNLIASNLAAALQTALRGGGSTAFSSAMRLVSTQTGEVAYPDVFVTCTPIKGRETQFEDAVLVAEVLSRPTSGYDQSAKFDLYGSLPSLRRYLLVSQDAREITDCRKTAAGWELRTVEGAAVLDLPELGCSISLDAIYEGVAV